jgi:branched-chain amino acid transport system permease protein
VTAPATAAAGAPLLACIGVSKRFGGIVALQDVSLEVVEGEILGLVGPNGSGKSTLISVVSGLYRPTAGRVELDGERLDRLPPHAISNRGVARTYQIPRPFPSLSLRDNVAVSGMFGRRRLNVRQAREAADEYLATCGLGAVADALPSAVNLHQRKFLEFARALATEPRVLFLDEVMAGLNPAEIEESVDMVRRIAATGTTLVVVEHLMRVITELATRLVVLDRGRVLASGPPREVMSREDVVTVYLGQDTHA